MSHWPRCCARATPAPTPPPTTSPSSAAALRQLPRIRAGHRPGRKILVRVDGAGATHELLDWLHAQRLSYSVGFGLTQPLVDQLAALPAADWQTAYNADGEPRPGAWVIEATGLMNLRGWPTGMRVIVRKERPHPGAQLRLTDPDGHRYTAFATNTRPGGSHRQLADLELRHRRRARAEDRIRAAKDTGLRNLPAARAGPEPDLAGRRRLGLRDHRLDPTARLHRAPRTAVGTQTTPAPDVLPACPGRPARPPCLATPARPRTLGRASARRPDPAARARRPWLNNTPPVPANPGTRPDPWNRRPERSRPNRHTQPAKCPHHTGQHQC